jgi:hypothetical protein
MVLLFKNSMKLPFLSAVVALGLIVQTEAGFLPLLPRDPNYVQLSARCSVYVVSVDSPEWHRFGLAGAPVVEPSRFNQGEGVDVVAVPFDRGGRVAFAPTYIYTVRPEQYRLQEMRGLVQGVTSKTDAERLFGSTPMKRQIRGYEVWFFEFRVRNPFEENPFSRH